MRRHIVQMHSDLEPPQEYKPLRDSLLGLPQCRHCKIKVTTRYMLKQHIEQRWCSAFDSEAADQTPICQREDVLERVTDQNWQSLLGDRPLCRELTHHCVLCQNWCAKTNGLETGTW